MKTREGIPSVGPCTYTRKKPEKGYEESFPCNEICKVSCALQDLPLKKWMSTAQHYLFFATFLMEINR